MQETRKQILEILHERGEATVDTIVCDLEERRGSITAVTVRHHLSKLQQDGLVTMPQMQHRSTPGRPQHIYALTDQGTSHFPNNYQQVTTKLLEQMTQHLSDSQVNVIIEGVAASISQDACIPQGTLQERLVAVVDYLNEHGYQASWEAQAEGFVLCTNNCPYHSVAQENESLCHLDMQLISNMLGTVPRLMGRVADGESSCSYLIPYATHDK